MMPAGAQVLDPGLPDTAIQQEQELVRQQERERALREQQEVRRDVRLEDGPEATFERLPTDETPCFPIHRIRLDGEDARRFRWALDAADPANDPATGSCLGTGGINTVMRRVQNAMVARGYVTTRVLAAPQDLNDGTLVLTVVPGRIRAVRYAEGADSRAALGNAVPGARGDLLNLRDIEQGLENLQRVPTVTADLQFVPAEGDDAQAGQSDLVVERRQRTILRTHLSLDDAGSKATGKLQAGATMSLDNALGLNDLFYVNLGRSVFNGGGKDASSWTAHFDMPYGRWLLGVTASAYDYRQAVAGAFETYVYSGNSANRELRVSRLLFRNASSRTGLYGRGWWRESDNFIDDTEVLVQRRRTAGWEAGLTHRHFIGAAVLDASVAYRRGTGAFSALPAPEEAFGEGASRVELVSADGRINLPFQLGAQRLRYSGAWRGQWSRKPLVPQDRFAIGGRYTVRGFDGEVSLSGERGWLLRNDLALALGGGHEAYLGTDYGRISGPSEQWQLGDHLAGAVIGLRGGWQGGHWDLFFGAPLREPDGFPSAYTTAGFSAGWSF